MRPKPKSGLGDEEEHLLPVDEIRVMNIRLGGKRQKEE